MDNPISPATIVSESFYDLTGCTLSTSSFLNMFNILKDPDGTRYINVFRYYVLGTKITSSSTYYYTYEVGNSDWWEYISYSYYTNVYLWWILAMMNDVVNPFEELEEGDLLKVLKTEYVLQIVSEVGTVGDL